MEVDYSFSEAMDEDRTYSYYVHNVLNFLESSPSVGSFSPDPSTLLRCQTHSNPFSER